MRPLSILPLRKFGALVSTKDTVDVGQGGLLSALNCIPRPIGAIRGPMLYSRLWAMGEDRASVTCTVAGDTFTRATHALIVGAVLRFTTTGVLPTGLTANTDFYIHSVPSADTFKVSATDGGSAITVSGGSGTLSYTATITMKALYRSLPFSGYAPGVGVNSAARIANKTIAVRTWRQGKHFVALYDLVNDKARGVFYMGDDGTHTGAYGFTSGTPSNEVLAVGLDSDAMWFGSRVAGLLMIQNGVDDSIAVQLDRTATPGKWRKCGSNAFPATPTVSLAPPNNDNTTRQADLAIPGPLVFFATYFASDVLYVSGPPLVDGLPFTATSAGTLPSGMSASTTYYVRDASYSAATGLTYFRISTSVGGSVVVIGDAGTGSHTLRSRAGAATITIQLDSNFKSGSSGNYTFMLVITASGYSRAISSTLTGIGTTSNPYIYTITCGTSAAQSSTDAIVDFINNDGKVIPLITASKSAADSTADTFATAGLRVVNGVGGGSSVGFTNKTVTVCLAYFDSGTNGFGYESPFSALTPEIYIAETSHNDIFVTITKNPTVEGGRFDSIRVYLQFGEGAEAIWNLMGSVPNVGEGTASLLIGTHLEIGLAQTEFDQNRPIPHKAIVGASSRTWRGGLLSMGFKERIYISKEATDDEKSPEGVGLEGYEIIDVPEATAPVAIRALYSDLYRLHVHTNQGIMIIDPANVENTPHRPAVNVGAMNPSCFGMGPNNAILYIGQDAQPYDFNGNRYGSRNIKSAAKEAEAIIRSFANVDAIGQNADKVSSFQDKSGLLWWFFPNDAGSIISVCLDIEQGGLWGYFDYPRAVSSCPMEPERPEIVIQDETGNLFIYDTTAQYDSGADLPAVATFAPTATTVSPTAGHSGYGYVDYESQRYLKAAWVVLETGHLDLSNMVKFNAFMGASFRFVANSRGILRATFTGVSSGLSVTRTFGDVGEYSDLGPKRLMLMLSDTAAKFKVEILTAEQKPVILRDVGILHR